MRQLDVRVLPPSKKHGTIHECLEQLASGETLRIVNDHDPRPLRYELDDAYPGAFAWTYVDCGPELWRVDISKKQELRRHSQIDVLADCHALRVGDVRIEAGRSFSFDSFEGTAALLVFDGDGIIAISGCSHTLKSGAVELICPGEPCTISAITSVHAYLVIAKDSPACAP